ncbi:MAG: hypothetical protein PWQ29_1537 [Verrucomicrobiota bacterium]|jgi:phosphoglycolate phosphatase-like HAD superfamily hydrolase|nr:hypothetical protein [Verrucomicrobiota bacterium]
MKQTWCKDDLIGFQPRHDVLIAVDSDGCVFDSMTVKQQICHSGIIKLWHLEEIEPEFRSVAEWTALYSPWRGLNRFELLLRIFQTLGKAHRFFPDRKPLPDFTALEDFVKSGVPLSADELAKRVKRTGDPELTRVLEWSRSVSDAIAEIARMPVFEEASAAIRKIHSLHDVIVVSQTAEEALAREWHHAGLADFADVIAGAELGSKAESLGTAMKGRYLPEKTLMVGDAPGDLNAARSVGCLFFPVLPGEENSSWEELSEEGLERIADGSFAGAYQDGLITRFNTALSRPPPWIR